MLLFLLLVIIIMVTVMLLVECQWIRPLHPKTRVSCQHGVGSSRMRKVVRREWKDPEL